MKWSSLSSKGKADFNAEEGLDPVGGWLDPYGGRERRSQLRDLYPSKHEWATAGSTIVDLHSPSPDGCINYGPGGKLCYYPPGEIGPQILRPDGHRVRHRIVHGKQRPWEHSHLRHRYRQVGRRPVFPNDDNAGDSFAVLLTNGDVLWRRLRHLLCIQWNHSDNRSGYSGKLDALADRSGAGRRRRHHGGLQLHRNLPGRMGAHHFGPPATVTPATTYSISGTQFNGLSQANAFGDELQTANQLSLGPNHQQQHASCVLCQNPRPQHHGSGHGHGDGFNQFRRPRGSSKPARAPCRLWPTAFLPRRLRLRSSKNGSN